MKGFYLVLGLALLGAGCGDDGSADADRASTPREREEEPRDQPDAGKKPRAGSGGDSADPEAGAGGSDTAGSSAPPLEPVDVEELGEMLDEPGLAKKWTVFIYGHADHNLSNSFVRDIVEMNEASIGDELDVIVLADFDASQEIAGSNGDTFTSGAEWLRIRGDGAEPELLGREPELNLDDPDVLAGAVAAAFRHFPSDRRALILWDHGGAWNGGFGGDTQDGRDNAPQPMTPRQVAAAVSASLGYFIEDNSDAKLDLFAFDTCLMAGAEVAFEFSELADAYIAAAEIDYGAGWDYEAFLTHLARNPDASTRALAEREVELWDAHHATATFNDALLRSHVALDTSALPALADALAKLVERWLASEELDGVELGRASYFALPPYMSQLESTQAEPELRDLGQFLELMGAVSDPALAAAAGAARGALEDAIIAGSHGSLRRAVRQLGLHVELPLAAGLSPELLRAYRERAVSFLAASRWNEVLTTYDKLDDGIPPQLRSEIFNHENPDSEHLPTVEFAAEGEDVAMAEVNLALFDPERETELTFYGVVGKSAIDADSAYQFSWDGQLLTLPDGESGVQAAYRTVWEDAGADDAGIAASVMASFGIFELSDGEQLLSALLFQDGDAVTSLIAFLDQPTTMTLAEVASDLPGSTFTPLYPVVSGVSGETTSVALGSPIPIDRESFPLDTGAAGPGQYALVTTVHDVFGNYDTDARIASLPAAIE